MASAMLSVNNSIENQAAAQGYRMKGMPQNGVAADGGTGLGASILGAAGLNGSWEAAAAQAAAKQLHDSNLQNQTGWAASQGLLNDASNNIAGTNYLGGAQNAFGVQQANYNQMQNAAGMLYNQATGNAPSMADLQMQAGLGQANNAVQSAMLSQQGGVSPGLSQRNMLAAQAMQNSNIVSSGAQNRAQELSTAQNNYSSLLGAMGSTASGMTNQQMTMGQQARQQHLDNLAYQTQAQSQAYGQNQGNYNADYAAQMANVQGQSGSNAQQYQAVGNDISSLANAGAGILSYAMKKNGEK